MHFAHTRGLLPQKQLSFHGKSQKYELAELTNMPHWKVTNVFSPIDGGSFMWKTWRERNKVIWRTQRCIEFNTVRICIRSYKLILYIILQIHLFYIYVLVYSLLNIFSIFKAVYIFFFFDLVLQTSMVIWLQELDVVIIFMKRRYL